MKSFKDGPVSSIFQTIEIESNGGLEDLDGNHLSSEFSDARESAPFKGFF